MAIRILHTTDWHAGATDSVEDLSEVIDSYIKEFKSRKDYMAIVATGDLADTRGDIGSAKKEIGKLKKEFRVFAVPGNHDMKKEGDSRKYNTTDPFSSRSFPREDVYTWGETTLVLIGMNTSEALIVDEAPRSVRELAFWQPGRIPLKYIMGEINRHDFNPKDPNRDASSLRRTFASFCQYYNAIEYPLGGVSVRQLRAVRDIIDRWAAHYQDYGERNKPFFVLYMHHNPHDDQTGDPLRKSYMMRNMVYSYAYDQGVPILWLYGHSHIRRHACVDILGESDAGIAAGREREGKSDLPATCTEIRISEQSITHVWVHTFEDL